jgi:hypothetical protein
VSGVAEQRTSDGFSCELQHLRVVRERFEPQFLGRCTHPGEQFERFVVVAGLAAAEQHASVVVLGMAIQSGDLIWAFIFRACSKWRAASSKRESVVASNPSGREAEPWQRPTMVTTQVRARTPVHLESVAVAPAAIEGQHQLRRQTLAPRMRGDERA